MWLCLIDKSMDLKVHPWRNPVLVDMLDLCHQRVHLLTYIATGKGKGTNAKISRKLWSICVGWIAETDENCLEKMEELSHEREGRLQ